VDEMKINAIYAEMAEENKMKKITHHIIAWI